MYGYNKMSNKLVLMGKVDLTDLVHPGHRTMGSIVRHVSHVSHV